MRPFQAATIPRELPLGAVAEGTASLASLTRSSSLRGDFDDFFQAHFSTVVGLLVADGTSIADAEDSAQEAFARALVRWKRLRAEPWAVGWVVVTATNHSRRRYRRNRRELPTPEIENRAGLEEVTSAFLFQYLKDLSPKQKLVVFLHYFLDLPVAQVALLLGITDGSVKTHLHRARERIRYSLKSQEEQDAGA